MEQPADNDYMKWLSDYNLPSIATRTDISKGGLTTYTTAPIKKGTLITMWGGTCVGPEKLALVPYPERSYHAQIEENIYLIGTTTSPSYFCNHSCDPNAGLYGYSALVALRDIDAGEDISFDYATVFVAPYEFEFDCHCGARLCRGRFTEDDWKIPELWQKYAGHFSPYIQRRIDKIKQSQAVGQQ